MSTATLSHEEHPDPSRHPSLFAENNLMAYVPRSYRFPERLLSAPRKARIGEDWAVVAAECMESRYAQLSGAPMAVPISAECISRIAPRSTMARGGEGVRLDLLYGAIERTPVLCVKPTGIGFRAKDSYGLARKHQELTVQNMRLDLIKRGPIHVLLRANAELRSHSCNSAGLIEEAVRGPMRAACVSGLLMGWNAEPTNGAGSPYWIVRLPWGDDWGSRATCRIRMGSDDFGIESCPWACIPEAQVLVDRKTWEGV